MDVERGCVVGDEGALARRVTSSMETDAREPAMRLVADDVGTEGAAAAAPGEDPAAAAAAGGADAGALLGNVTLYMAVW